MNTKGPLMIVLCIGVAVAMYQGSGAGALLGYGPSEQLQSGDVVSEKGGEYNVEEGSSGEVNPDADSDIVGVIIGGSLKFVGLLVVPGLLTAELTSFGLWTWAAVPLGLLGNIITYIGLFQVTTGRVYE